MLAIVSRANGGRQQLAWRKSISRDDALAPRLVHGFAFSLGASCNHSTRPKQQTHLLSSKHRGTAFSSVVSIGDRTEMPGTVTKAPAKRALAETSNTRTNVQTSPRSTKKLKVQDGKEKSSAPAKIANDSFNSNQAGPSQFEETLEQMTQEMEALKKGNSEKDQQWRRPLLPEDFNEMTSNLVFQQIEAEEGVLHGGKTTVKLFGVTEVRRLVLEI